MQIHHAAVLSSVITSARVALQGREEYPVPRGRHLRNSGAKRQPAGCRRTMFGPDEMV